MKSRIVNPNIAHRARTPILWGLGIVVLVAMLLASCSGGATFAPRRLTSLSVKPADVEAVAPTGTAQFSAIGTFDQAPMTDTSVAVQWTTSDSTVVAIDAVGIATCLAMGGPITVTASGQGKTGTVNGSATLTCLSSNPSGGVGKCVVGGNTLSGYCIGVRGGICREAYDPTNCPPHTSVSNAQANQCAHSSFTVDSMRSCTP